MAGLTYAVEVQLAPSVWTNISADVLGEDGLSIDYGVPGNGPLDVMAGAGECQFTLRNDARNSGATQGWYSPGHRLCRSGWTFGIPVRVTFTLWGTPHVKHRGTIRHIDAQPGQYGAQRVRVTAFDVMRDLIDADIRQVAIQVNQTSDQLITAVLAALPAAAQPAALDLDVGSDVYPYAFDELGAGAKAASAILSATISGLAFTAVTGDGTLIHRNRSTRESGSSAFALRDDMHDLVAPSSLDGVYNRFRAVTHPKTIATAATVLYTQQGALSLTPGETRTFWGEYRDYTDERTLIGAINVVDPLVAYTDYAGNGLPDGTGTDLTADLAVTITPFASTVQFEITNNGAGTVYLVDGMGAPFLQVRGEAVRDIGAETYEAYGAEDYGDRPLTIDLPYQDDPFVAQAIADYLLGIYRDYTTQVSSVSFLAAKSLTLMTQALEREVGDLITISETLTGVTLETMRIHRIRLEIEKGLWITCHWGLAPATFREAWQLGVAGRSELGTTTSLAF